MAKADTLLLTYTAADVATQSATIFKQFPAPTGTLTQFSLTLPDGQPATDGDYIFTVYKEAFSSGTESILTTITVAEGDEDGYSDVISEACVFGDRLRVVLSTLPTGATMYQPVILQVDYTRTINADDSDSLGGVSAATITSNINAKQAALSGASLTSVTVATNDKVLIQDTSDSNNLKTVTAQSIADLSAGGTTSSIGTLIDSAGAETAPADGDFFAFADISASNILKKITWANVKATLKTYFDTLYQAVLVSGTNIKTINSTSLLGSGDIAISGSVATDAIFDAKGDLPVGTGSNTAAKLPVGTNGQFLKADSGEATGLIWDTIPGGGDMLSTNNLSDVANVATAKTNLGLGTGDSPQFTALNVGHASDTTLTRDSAGNLAVEGNLIYRAGGTDVPVADGGTGASSASAARTNLGLVIGTDVKAFNSPTPIGIACSDETTAITTGTAKATFRMPFAFTLTEVRASVTTAPTGSTIIIDINENGSTILSTKLSIDASEKTSTTAASAAVISDTSLADDAEITIDFDQVGSTIAGTGVKVWLIGYKTT